MTKKMKVYYLTLTSVIYWSLIPEFSTVLAAGTSVSKNANQTNIVTSIINWILLIGAIYLAWYAFKKLPSIMQGGESIWKALGLILAGFLILGVIAVAINFDTIANTFSGIIEGVTDKAANELNNTIGK